MKKIVLIGSALLLASTSCKNNDPVDPVSDDLRITSFSVTNAGLTENQRVEGIINGAAIQLTVPYETVDSLIVNAEAPAYVKIHPAPGIKWKMTDKTTTFIAFSGLKMQEYQVTVQKAAPVEPTVMEVGFTSESGVAFGAAIDVMQRLITVRIYEGMPQKAVLKSFELLPQGTVAKIDGQNPINGVLDFTDLKATYMLTAENGGKTVDWKIAAEVVPGGVDLPKSTTLLESSKMFLTSLNNGGVRDAVISDGYIFWTSRVGGSFVYCNSVENTAAGKDDTVVALKAPAGGYSGGTFPVSSIAVSNGHIYVTNMGMNSTSSQFKIYYWANREAQGEVICAFNHPVDNIRLGDAITLDLDADGNGRLFASDFSNSKVFYVFPVTGYKTIGEPTRVAYQTSAADNGQYVTVNRVPWTTNQYVITGGDMGMVVGTLSEDNTIFTKLSEVVGVSAVPTRTYQAVFFEIAGGRYMAYTYATDAAPSREARLWVVNLSGYADMTEAFEALNTSAMLNTFPAPNSQLLWAAEYGKKTDGAAGTTYGSTSFEIAADGFSVDVFSFSCQRGYTLRQFKKN